VSGRVAASALSVNPRRLETRRCDRSAVALLMPSAPAVVFPLVFRGPAFPQERPTRSRQLWSIPPGVPAPALVPVSVSVVRE
jgi:hypothetical protein